MLNRDKFVPSSSASLFGTIETFGTFGTTVEQIETQKQYERGEREEKEEKEGDFHHSLSSFPKHPQPHFKYQT